MDALPESFSVMTGPTSSVPLLDTSTESGQLEAMATPPLPLPPATLMETEPSLTVIADPDTHPVGVLVERLPPRRISGAYGGPPDEVLGPDVVQILGVASRK